MRGTVCGGYLGFHTHTEPEGVIGLKVGLALILFGWVGLSRFRSAICCLVFVTMECNVVLGGIPIITWCFGLAAIGFWN